MARPGTLDRRLGDWSDRAPVAIDDERCYQRQGLNLGCQKN